MLADELAAGQNVSVDSPKEVVLGHPGLQIQVDV